MVFKLVIALAVVTATSAGLIPGQQVIYQTAPKAIGIAQPVYSKTVESNAAYPKYQFSYAVNDEHTGDVKSQVESRDGDVVQGEYSLIDADGYKRVVQYSADHDHGFNAVVQREPIGHAVKSAAPAPITKAASQIKIAPVSYTAPALIKSGQVAYATAPALIKSAPLTSVPAPPQVKYVSQPLIKPSPVSYAAAPAQPSYNSQSFIKPVRVAYASAPLQPLHTSQAFVKAIQVSHAAKPAPASFIRQPIIKPVAYAATPAQGAYVQQFNVKSVGSPYGGRSTYY